MSETYFLKSKVRNFVKENGLKVSKEVVNGEKLNNDIKKILSDAVERAIGNGRKTLMEKDL